MAAGGQPGGSQAADEGSIDEATFSRGFPVGAGTGGAARSIKAADGSEFLTVAMSTELMLAPNRSTQAVATLRDCRRSPQDLVRDDGHDVG
jgi:hypothetical protein